MRLRLGKITKRELRAFYKYGIENFGYRVATEHYDNIIRKINRLKKFPESGFPEPLLKNRKSLYRAIVVEKRYKVIYRVNYKKNEVFIRDLWNLKRSPETLMKRIK